ncbi:DNA recombination protein RmuC, partial [Acinetobacter baumannii]
AMHAVRQTVNAHIEDIASKYLLPGETQDTALMFVPSESIYAELHERFPDIVQRAHRARVFIVAPNILMLAVSTVQAVIKDVRMREQA